MGPGGHGRERAARLELWRAELVPGEAAGPVSLEGEWTAWALEGVRCDKLEGEEVVPGGAVWPGSLEGEWTGRVLDGMEIDELEGVELGPGGALGPESLEGDGVACSRDGDVEP